jgi:hypothetical protein
MYIKHQSLLDFVSCLHSLPINAHIQVTPSLNALLPSISPTQVSCKSAVLRPFTAATDTSFQLTMKYTTLITAVALLATGALALPKPDPEAAANPQICSCVLGCYDTCGQKLCC